jgi:hypothetical protein
MPHSAWLLSSMDTALIEVSINASQLQKHRPQPKSLAQSKTGNGLRDGAEVVGALPNPSKLPKAVIGVVSIIV